MPVVDIGLIGMNINERVVVTLTGRGEDILYRYYNHALLRGGCSKGLSLTNEMVARLQAHRLVESHHIDGHIYRFQLWKLMEVFGIHINGFQQVFVDNEVKRYKGRG